MRTSTEDGAPCVRVARYPLLPNLLMVGYAPLPCPVAPGPWASALAPGCGPYPQGPAGLLRPGCLLQGDDGGQGYVLPDRDTWL